MQTHIQHCTVFRLQPAWLAPYSLHVLTGKTTRLQQQTRQVYSPNQLSQGTAERALKGLLHCQAKQHKALCTLWCLQDSFFHLEKNLNLDCVNLVIGFFWAPIPL